MTQPANWGAPSGQLFEKRRVRRTALTGPGCIVQVLGVPAAGALVWYFAPYNHYSTTLTVFGVGLAAAFAAGLTMNYAFSCGHCGNKVEATTRLCPTCGCTVLP